VLSIDAAREHFRPNPAAARMLGRPEWSQEWQRLSELDRPGLAALHERLMASPTASLSVELDLEADGETVHVDITSRPLPGGGRVVAIDDLTQLMQAQRQAAWSEVAQRIAHEIRNPLTPIQLAAERIQRRAGALDDEMRAIVSSGCEAIVAQVSGLKALVDAFQEFARMPPVALESTDIARLLGELRALYDGVRPGLEVVAEVEPRTLRAIVDPVLLRQALVNLLDNAVAAIAGDGRVRIAARAQGNDLVIEVEDSGVGLPTEDPEVLLQPFFSTKGRGSGMGLAMVHRAVTDHGGSLELGNLRPGGAVARIVLPAALPDPAVSAQ